MTHYFKKPIFSCNFWLICQAAGTGPAEESEQEKGEECLVIKIMSAWESTNPFILGLGTVFLDRELDLTIIVVII